MAVLHNKNDYYGGFEKPKKKADKIDKTVFDFLDDTLTEYNKENVLMHKGTPIYFTPDFDVKNVTAFSVGVTIGEIKKNYILPHHQFFTTFGNDFKRKIDLDPNGQETSTYITKSTASSNVIMKRVIFGSVIVIGLPDIICSTQRGITDPRDAITLP